MPTVVLLLGLPALALPTGFQDTPVFSGLTEPTTIEFASDGRVFVAEKSGLIKVFDGLADTTPTVFADLRVNVHNFWDRGLLGLALHPQFPNQPYVYVLYTHNAAVGGTAPLWPTLDGTSDYCPDPPGATTNGCVVSGRLSRLTASGNQAVGPEQVLIEDWCQQFPGHSIGSVEFGSDGALYVSGGDGASSQFADYGQTGQPRNPCGDPPVGVGGLQTPPTAQGGALRSQDAQTPSDPVGLGGTVLRVDPATGEGMPDNPWAGSADPNLRRIVAYGLRNPFRLTARPALPEIWIGDVGWAGWEELDRLVNPTAEPPNFGWPCREGPPVQGGYEAAGLDLCTAVYAAGNAVRAPFFAYQHFEPVVAGDGCPTGSSSVSGLAFYAGGTYPAPYAGALFFADYSRGCIWAMIDPPLGSGVARGLVAAYGFDEGSGASVADAAGNFYHTGSISGASWTSGRYGGALRFDGVNDWVTVPDSDLLDLTTGMTISAWVFPTAHGSGVWRNVLIKEDATREIYNLYSNVDLSRSRAYLVRDSAPQSPLEATGSNQPPLDTWTHLAATYDGATLKVYQNGTEVGSRPGGGALLVSTGPLRIGGNSIWGEHFEGLIDEVRVYDRALEVSEILDDMNRPVAGGPPPRPVPFLAGDIHPVDLEVGPNGDLFYVDLEGQVRRIRYLGANQPPDAVVQATPTSGPAPLTVAFNGSASSDPDAGDTLSYAWDLDGDGAYDDSTSLQPTYTFGSSGSYVVSLRVTDNHGASATAQTTIVVGNPPIPVIDTPLAGATWAVGDLIAFSGHASDPDAGALPASALSWALVLQHCAPNCHDHPLSSWSGVATGSFSAPDHGYPAYLELHLTATDASGARATVSRRLDPQSVDLTLETEPAGLQVGLNASVVSTPITVTVIRGSANSLSAPTPQNSGGQVYAFASWSDGGAATHNVTAQTTTTFTATYDPVVATGPVAAWGFEESSGPTVGDATGNGHTGTISGASRITGGKYGRALSFDGADDWVTVADTDALDLGSGMTVSAWVYPTGPASGAWRNVLIKEDASREVYNLYANVDINRPMIYVVLDADPSPQEAHGTFQLPPNAWTHLAVTYDGSVLRMFVNGNLLGARVLGGRLKASAGPLRIGGNSIWGEFFGGRIDEVRVYNRALSASEIQADKNRPIVP